MYPPVIEQNLEYLKRSQCAKTKDCSAVDGIGLLLSWSSVVCIRPEAMIGTMCPMPKRKE